MATGAQKLAHQSSMMMWRILGQIVGGIVGGIDFSSEQLLVKSTPRAFIKTRDRLLFFCGR